MISQANKQIRKQYKKAFLICDILIVMIFLMNLSCLFMTNIMVTKTTPPEDLEFKEVNPITAYVGDFQEHPESKIRFPKEILYAICWGLILFGYLFSKYTIKSMFDYWTFIATVTFIFVFILRNFTNDFGYFVGVML